MSKVYEELSFTDDFMFCKILQNNEELTKQLVEMILGVKISRVEGLAAQHTIEDSLDSKGIRLDVYFKDDENNAYDIEMQTYTDGNLLARNRYYHSLIAIDNLKKGMKYNEIINSYVIFICTFDPFGLGSPIYTARTRFDEHPAEIIEDGAVSIFLNCNSKSKEISADLQSFFKYVRENQTSEGLTEAIECDILKAKNQKNWRQEYMTLYEHEERARAEGRAEAVREIIEKMKAEGISLEDACRIIGISQEEYEISYNR